MPHASISLLYQGNSASARDELNQITPGTEPTSQAQTSRTLVKFLSGSQETPSLSGLENLALSKLFELINVCDKQLLDSALFHISEQLVPRMPLRTEVLQFDGIMWQLYKIDPKKSLLSLKRFGLRSSNAEVTKASVDQLQAWTNVLGTRIAFHDLTQTIVDSMKDSHKETREAAYSLLISFFAQARPEVQRHLFDTMTESGISEHLIVKMQSAITRNNVDKSDVSKETLNPVLTGTTNLLDRQDDPLNKSSSATGNPSCGLGIRERSSSKGTDDNIGGCSSFENRTHKIMNDPMYAFQPLEDKYPISNEEFLTKVGSFVKAFDGKETENNWSIRLNHVRAYRKMIQSYYQVLSPKSMCEALRILRRGLCEASVSLRTVLVCEICYAVKDTAQVVSGRQPNFHEVFDPFMEALAKVATGPKKITSAAAHLAISVLSIECLSVSSRQFSVIMTESKSIKANARPLAYNWLELIITPTLIPSLLLHETEIETIIYRAINDASPAGRSQGRELFKLVEALWPSIAYRIVPRLNSSSLRLLNLKSTKPAQVPVHPSLSSTRLQETLHGFSPSRSQSPARSASPRVRSPRGPSSPVYSQTMKRDSSGSQLSKVTRLRSDSFPVEVQQPEVRMDETSLNSEAYPFEERVTPALTSSPVKPLMREHDISRSIGDSSLRDNNEYHMSIDEIDTTRNTEADMNNAHVDHVRNGDEPLDSLEGDKKEPGIFIKYLDAPSNLSDSSAIKEACKIDTPALVKAIAFENLSFDHLKQLLTLICNSSEYDSRRSLQKLIQNTFQTADSERECDGYLSMLRVLRDISDNDAEPSIPLGNILDDLESPLLPSAMANSIHDNSSPELDRNSGPFSRHIDDHGSPAADEMMFERGRSGSRRSFAILNADSPVQENASTLDDSPSRVEQHVSLAQTEISKPTEHNESLITHTEMSQSESPRSSFLNSRDNFTTSHISDSDTSVGMRTQIDSHHSAPLSVDQSRELDIASRDLSMSSYLTDAARLIPLFPSTAEQCITMIRNIITRSKDHTAEPQDLAVLSVLIKASTYEQNSKSPLSAPLSVWRSRFTFDMDVRESISPYLSSSEKSEEQIICGLVLLRMLLVTSTPYSKPYLDTLKCVRHLCIVATNFQRESLMIADSLREIYTSLADREIGSSIGSMNELNLQQNMISSLQLVTQIIERHSDFANEANKGLQTLVQSATRDPDVRVRQHLYPMLVTLHEQNRPIFDLVVTSMSAGQQKFVDYYVEVKKGSAAAAGI